MLTGDNMDLGLAIPLHREALWLRPAPHPDCPSSLTNLANTLTTRSKQIGNIKDMNEAISLLQTALTLQPVFHLYHSDSINNLGTALYT